MEKFKQFLANHKDAVVDLVHYACLWGMFTCGAAAGWFLYDAQIKSFHSGFKSGLELGGILHEKD